MSPLSKVIFILVIIVLALATTKFRVGGMNDASRMATVQSLVEKQSYIIDESVFVKTIDKPFPYVHEILLHHQCPGR